jgi:hypothetical protein
MVVYIFHASRKFEEKHGIDAADDVPATNETWLRSYAAFI